MTNTLTHGERRLGRPTWRNSATVGALPGASPAPHRSSCKTLRASAPPSRYPGALPFGCAHHRARSRTRPPGELRRITHPTPAPGAGRLAISAPSLPFPPSPNLPAVRDRSSGMPQRKASERDWSYLATCHTSGVIGRNVPHLIGRNASLRVPHLVRPIRAVSPPAATQVGAVLEWPGGRQSTAGSRPRAPRPL